MLSNVAVTELRGIGLPALQGPGGVFASKNKYDVAFSDLITAVFTPIGSRPMNRSFGSAVHNVLFDPSTVTAQQMVDFTIKQAVQTWAPHLYVESVSMLAKGRPVAVGVKFGLVEERATQDRVILLTKSDLLRLIDVQGRT